VEEKKWREKTRSRTIQKTMLTEGKGKKGGKGNGQIQLSERRIDSVGGEEQKQTPGFSEPHPGRGKKKKGLPFWKEGTNRKKGKKS